MHLLGQINHIKEKKPHTHTKNPKKTQKKAKDKNILKGDLEVQRGHSAAVNRG